MEFFLVRIFPHSNWIRRDTSYLSVFSPNAGKYGSEKTPYLDTFQAVIVLWLSYNQCRYVDKSPNSLYVFWEKYYWGNHWLLIWNDVKPLFSVKKERASKCKTSIYRSSHRKYHIKKLFLKVQSCKLKKHR